jgi:CubicO group peptidase (beta-lactamase class C family)
MAHELQRFLQQHVDDGTYPGAVALVAHGDQVEVAAAGNLASGGPPMERDAIFRIASITKPIIVAGLLTLIDEGRIGLHDPVDAWLPELASPMVVRTPSSLVEDVVPADRSITVRDLLTFTSGYGFASDFSLPQVQALSAVQKDGRHPATFPPPDKWLAALSRIPLLYQPGQMWLYDTSATIQGILISRISDMSLGKVLAERIFDPLGMTDTAFSVPEAKRGRFTSYYEPSPDGALRLVDPPDGQWASPPALELGNGGLVSTIDDWFRFARMLRDGGMRDGRRVLSQESVRAMTTDQLTADQRTAADLFLDGQSWGYGGSVDIAPLHPWNVPGRYGWVGGTGTSAYIVPATHAIEILFTQVAVGPAPPRGLLDFWEYVSRDAPSHEAWAESAG